jgi:outer membrane protein
MRFFLCFLLLVSSCAAPVSRFDGTLTNQSPIKIQGEVFQAGLEEPRELGKELQLADLIDIALKNNPETKSSWYKARAAAARLGLAKSELYPKLDARADGAHMRTFEFLGGPAITDNRAFAGLMLSYLLLDFGERSAIIGMAKEGLKIANWSHDWKIQEIMIGLLGRYYEYLNAKGLLEAEEATSKEAQKRVEAVEEFCQAGIKSKSDLLAAKSDCIQSKLRLSEKQQYVAISLASLAKNLGISVETPLRIANIPDPVEIASISDTIDIFIERAKEKRIDLLALHAEMSQKNLELKRVQASHWPKLDALAKGGWAYDEKSSSKGIYNYTLAVSLNAPLFAGFRKTYERRKAYAEAQETLADIIEKENAISFDVLKNFKALKTAEEKIHLSAEYVNYAEEAYASSLENYQAGVINIFSLLDSGKTLSMARDSRAQAKINWFAAMAQLAYATGTLLED